MQEFAENSADLRHIVPLHSRLMVPFTTIPVPFIGILHEAAWSVFSVSQEYPQPYSIIYYSPTGYPKRNNSRRLKKGRTGRSPTKKTKTVRDRKTRKKVSTPQGVTSHTFSIPPG